MDTAYGRHFTVDRPGCQVHRWLTGPDDAPLVTLPHAALVDCSNCHRPAQVNEVICPFLQRVVPG